MFHRFFKKTGCFETSTAAAIEVVHWRRIQPWNSKSVTVSVKWSQLTMLPKPTNIISHSCKISAVYLPHCQYFPLISCTCSIYAKPSQIIGCDKFSLPVNQMPNVSRSDAVATLNKWYLFLWIHSVNWQYKHFCFFFWGVILGSRRVTFQILALRK